MMKPFSWVQDYVEKLAEDNPDNAMVPDLYFHSDGKPCCIFGHVFDALGAEFAETENDAFVASSDGEAIVREGIGAWDADWPKLGIEAPNASQSEWVRDVQETQDSGESWSRAVFLAGRP